jgi:hypothetical protein
MISEQFKYNFLFFSSSIDMPNVDMPILEAPPLTSKTTLDQQDEDFLRELTSYNSYPSNDEANKPQENFETFKGEHLSK